MRINKLFSNYGICSRKEVNNLIEQGRIKINGQISKKGQWVEEDDEILFDDKPITKMPKVYIAFNKPTGITTTLDKSVRNNIIEFISYPQYIFPVGRLDKESEGLILLTNDGDLADSILNSENHHEKEYVVTVDKDFNDDFIFSMSDGVVINEKPGSKIKRISDTEGIVYEDGVSRKILLKDKNIRNEAGKNNTVKTRKCNVYRLDNNKFGIVLTQGLNRQIRKMCGSLGYNVVKLERVRILNVKLGSLKTGEYRNLSKEEIELLKKI